MCDCECRKVKKSKKSKIKVVSYDQAKRVVDENILLQERLAEKDKHIIYLVGKLVDEWAKEL